MAYEKTTWVTGDVITAEKLNHAEDGIAAGSETGKIEYDADTGDLRISFNKITEMIESGRVPWMVFVDLVGGVEIDCIARLSAFYVKPGSYFCEFVYMNTQQEVHKLKFNNSDPNGPMRYVS